jgi:polypeptide N-acetylgalactosaminyltransferase
MAVLRGVVLLALLGALLVAHSEARKVVGKLPKKPPPARQGLSPISMPSTEKYHRVLADEALRANLTTKARTPEEQAEYLAGYERHQFNQWISDRLSLHRRAYDTRAVECLHEKFSPLSSLGTTSVVIIFYNEAVSTLLRTAWSVVDRTPPELLKEVILVDDGSTREDLGPTLVAKVASIPKTRLVRLNERVGLIQAKINGAREATGDVLMFMDSHCECNDGWLEPLLDTIHADRRAVAIPIIDAIEFETFEHRTSILQRGMFSWSLNFIWQDITNQEQALRSGPPEALVSPAMAGGIFAIDRKFFWDVGAYDEGMDTWGGENIEMSFRIWMCGGQLVTLPCSRIGHVFRNKSPYGFKGRSATETIGRNLNRAAAVWMDEYAEVYYKASNHKQYGFGDEASLQARRDLRKNLRCKDFHWYLENVATDVFVPEPESFHQSGMIVNKGTAQCVQQLGSNDDARFKPVLDSGVGICTRDRVWYLTLAPVEGELRNEDAYGSRCLSAAHASTDHEKVRVVRCHDEEWLGTVQWDAHEGGAFVHRASGRCLTAEGSDLVVATCVWPALPSQQWTFKSVEDEESASNTDDTSKLAGNDGEQDDDEEQLSNVTPSSKYDEGAGAGEHGLNAHMEL